MNYIASFFSYGEQKQRKELTQEQQDFIVKLKTTKGLFQHFQEEFIEDVLCAQVTDVVLSTSVKKKGAVPDFGFKAIFMGSNITFRVLDKELENGEQTCIPVLHFDNVEFDEN